jgi:hypothetical protein
MLVSLSQHPPLASSLSLARYRMAPALHGAKPATSCRRRGQLIAMPEPAARGRAASVRGDLMRGPAGNSPRGVVGSRAVNRLNTAKVVLQHTRIAPGATTVAEEAGMTRKTGLFKQCTCVNPMTRRRWGDACPLLRRGTSWSPDHGSWHYQFDLPPDPRGARRSVGRGGFVTQQEAQHEIDQLNELMALVRSTETDAVEQMVAVILDAFRRGGPLPITDRSRVEVEHDVPAHELPTVGEWLRYWLTIRHGLRANSRLNYETHVRLCLTPHLGHIRLDRLRQHHINDMITALHHRNTDIRECRASPNAHTRDSVRGQRLLGPATLRRIHACLRKALNDAIGHELITTNPALHVELSSGGRPWPMLWTEDRVADWRATGCLPSPVMVWTPEQTGRFLDHAMGDRLYPLFHVLALRGLRRGEVIGPTGTISLRTTRSCDGKDSDR